MRLKIIAGSSRPGRFNIQPARWVYELAKQRHDLQVELLDLDQIDLPFLNEPTPPSRGQYKHEHTQEWAATIAEADAFIWVTPEYNHSVSAVLKNAIDYLYAEWNFKPVAFVSYGSLAGGARAAEHLRGIAGELKMYDLRDQILLPNYYFNLDKQGKYKFSEDQESQANGMLDQLVFWGERMKAAREELSESRSLEAANRS